MWREWKIEWMKVQRRGIGLLVFLFWGVTALWSTWVLHGVPKSQLEDEFRMMIFQLPLMDTILMPTMIAMTASRLCDMEVKGNTLKLLCTMERKEHIFDIKLLTGVCYLTLFVVMQMGMMVVQGALYGFVGSLQPRQFFFFFLQIYVVSVGILLLQVILSFSFENQILPLAAGLFGSFMGLFSWFFPKGFLKKCILWSYYSDLCFMINDWDREAGTVTYYDAPFDFLSLGILLIIVAAGYVAGKKYFLRKEL